MKGLCCCYEVYDCCYQRFIEKHSPQAVFINFSLYVRNKCRDQVLLIKSDGDKEFPFFICNIFLFFFLPKLTLMLPLCFTFSSRSFKWPVARCRFPSPADGKGFSQLNVQRFHQQFSKQAVLNPPTSFSHTNNCFLFSPHENTSHAPRVCRPPTMFSLVLHNCSYFSIL